MRHSTQRHPDIQYNKTQPIDIQHCDTWHKGTQHNATSHRVSFMLSVTKSPLCLMSSYFVSFCRESWHQKMTSLREPISWAKVKNYWIPSIVHFCNCVASIMYCPLSHQNVRWKNLMPKLSSLAYYLIILLLWTSSMIYDFQKSNTT